MATNECKVYAVLPAAGSGQRFGAELPKQFTEVHGKPIICYTIEAFSRIEWIEKIVVVVSSEWKQFTEELIKKYGFEKVELVLGKDTRHRSIHIGLQALHSCSQDDVVVVHDAVRPFLEQDYLKLVVDAAIKHQASGAVRNLVSTVVKSNDEGFMEYSLVRSEFRESHTPQAFLMKTLRQAYNKCTEEDFLYGTECLNLVQKYCDVNAKLISGPEYLWKVTHQKDIILMQSYLNRQEKNE